MKRIARMVALLVACLLIYGAWIKIRSMDFDDGGLPLAIRWEGFYHDMNVRDVGDSVNQCLGQRFFQSGVVIRSAGWFSGWSCDKVRNPDVIYSLNYSPERSERYFCQEKDQKIIGRYFNPNTQLKDLEFINTWSNMEIRNAACGFFQDIFTSIRQERKILIHCDAGRDRTGTVSALIAALGAEINGKINQRMIRAIECDYRKTESLARDKYNRIGNFLDKIQKQGGVIAFFENQCSIPRDLLKETADKLQL